MTTATPTTATKAMRARKATTAKRAPSWCAWPPTDPEAPYTAASVMPTAIINGEGRVKKNGPADSPTGVAPTPGWGNIVPPVTHPSGATFGGLNFGGDGRAIWDAGCWARGPTR